MTLLEKIEQNKEDLLTIRHQIHRHPETAFEEIETTKLIKKALDDAGIENHPNGDSTGVIGLIHGAKEGPVLAIRADIDALPIKENTGLPFSSEVSGKCHACGHDLHTTVLIGAARLLKEYQNDLCGTIKLIFQPAEEVMTGAAKTIANGALENPKPDFIIACHTWPDMPAGSIGVRKGTMLGASDSFKVTVIGKGGHAAHPQKGIDPVVIAAHIITQLQTIVSRRVAAIDPVVVTVGHLEAGTAANIIPNEAYFEGTVRTQSNETRNHVAEILKQLAVGTARAMGGDAEVSYTFGVGPTISEDHLVDEISEAVTELLGNDKLLQVPSPSMGSEDFARYLERIPGAIFRLGTHNDTPESKLALHNASLLFDEKAIPTGVATMVGAAFKITGSDMSVLLK
ncbi:MAG: M20 metallopeptidase family protein [Pilosibacter sp.]